MVMMTPQEIRRIRKAKRLTQEEFGALLGVTKSCVCCWESGKSHPMYDKMVELNKLASELEREPASA